MQNSLFLNSCCLGVSLTVVDPMVPQITEDSDMTRPLCSRLEDFGAGLERSVVITLNYEPQGFATAGKAVTYFPPC